MRVSAFCPGHVTGFFEICPSEDLLSMGSRGAGLCLSLGATATVDFKKSARQVIDIRLNGQKTPAPVTKSALKHLLGERKVSVKVDIIHDLPLHQGFGMSAAGALSSAIALASGLKIDRQKAFEAAHIAEIENKSGLGDVSALRKGGITIRVKPGLPPRGRVVNIDGVPTVVMAVVGKDLKTRSVLNDPKKRKKINESGGKLVDRLLCQPSFERFMELSWEFAVESGLASREVIEATGAASKLGMASMAMLGNSVFAVGDTLGLVSVLSDFGEVWVCRVDPRGPRVIRKG